MKIPPEEGHVMSRSLLVFSVCRGGKISRGSEEEGELRKTSNHLANMEWLSLLILQRLNLEENQEC